MIVGPAGESRGKGFIKLSESPVHELISEPAMILKNRARNLSDYGKGLPRMSGFIPRYGTQNVNVVQSVPVPTS